MADDIVAGPGVGGFVQEHKGLVYGGAVVFGLVLFAVYYFIKKGGASSGTSTANSAYGPQYQVSGATGADINSLENSLLGSLGSYQSAQSAQQQQASADLNSGFTGLQTQLGNLSNQIGSLNQQSFSNPPGSTGASGGQTPPAPASGASGSPTPSANLGGGYTQIASDVYTQGISNPGVQVDNLPSQVQNSIYAAVNPQQFQGPGGLYSGPADSPLGKYLTALAGHKAA